MMRCTHDGTSTVYIAAYGMIQARRCPRCARVFKGPR
jgi:hypothetical protein